MYTNPSPAAAPAGGACATSKMAPSYGNTCRLGPPSCWHLLFSTCSLRYLLPAVPAFTCTCPWAPEIEPRSVEQAHPRTYHHSQAQHQPFKTADTFTGKDGSVPCWAPDCNTGAQSDHAVNSTFQFRSHDTAHLSMCFKFWLPQCRTAQVCCVHSLNLHVDSRPSSRRGFQPEVG
jgi:hypothetical protein